MIGPILIYLVLCYEQPVKCYELGTLDLFGHRLVHMHKQGLIHALAARLRDARAAARKSLNTLLIQYNSTLSSSSITRPFS